MPIAVAAPVPPADLPVALVDIIDFKWLMAGMGHGVHVERMQTDAEYAGRCLRCGAQSPMPMLRATARRLARAMRIDLGLPVASAVAGASSPSR